MSFLPCARKWRLDFVNKIDPLKAGEMRAVTKLLALTVAKSLLDTYKGTSLLWPFVFL
jgi:hypothetical protein